MFLVSPKMETTNIAMIFLLCVIQILIGSSHGISESPNEYQWVDFTPELINDTRLVYFTRGPFVSYVVARVIYDNGDKIPCEGAIYVGETEIEPIVATQAGYTKMQVLLIEPGYYEWIPSRNGLVGSNVIEGGRKENEKIYVCWSEYFDFRYAGWMQPSCFACFATIDPKQKHDTYYLLTLKTTFELPPTTAETTTTKFSSTTPATPTAILTPTDATTPTIPEYQWVDFTPELINDTRLVYFARKPHVSYVVARVIYDNGNKVPCEGAIYIGETEIEPMVAPQAGYTKMQVLLIEPPGYYEWIPSGYGITGSNVIEGGQKENENIYVCWIKYPDFHYAGWMQPSRHACFVTVDQQFYETYHLLILRSL